MPKIALFRTKLFQVFFIIAMVVGIGISFAIDTDNDGMSDLYEIFFKLSSTNSLDAADNLDDDMLDNLGESILWTDPREGDTDADGFPDGTDSNALSRAVILWGHPDFTVGDDYTYTGPDWWLGASKTGGSWDASGLGWGVELNNSNSWVLTVHKLSPPSTCLKRSWSCSRLSRR